MRNTKLILVLFLGTLIFLSGCKVTFTRSIRSQIEAKGLELKKIQYYNSQKIVLKRVLTNKDANVTSGEVRLENGMYVEQVEIDKNTPGVVEEVREGALLIRFEEGENRTLLFEEDRAFGEYVLKTEKWDRNKSNSQYSEFFNLYNGEVMYDNKKYYINNSLSKPRLKIKKKESNNVTVDRRKAKGVLVE